MKTSKFSISQIIGILKQNEAGITVVDLCREHGIGRATFYKWRAKYGNADISMAEKLKELEKENARLKKLYIEEKLIADLRKEALEGKW